MMLLLGAVVALVLASSRSVQMGIDPVVIYSMCFWGGLSGILGARIFYVVENWDTKFQFVNWRETIARLTSYEQVGGVMYGALIFGAVAFLCVVRIHRLSALGLADIVAPGLMVGLAIGRIGCLLNGCCYGRISDLPWAVTFPMKSAPDRYSAPYQNQVSDGELYGFRLTGDHYRRPIVAQIVESSSASEVGLAAGDVVTHINNQVVTDLEQARMLLWNAFLSHTGIRMTTGGGGSLEFPPVAIPSRSLPVHPTQLYSAVSASLIAWLLWAYYPYRRREGEVFALMLTIYPITCYVIEIFRIDTDSVFGTGMSISQNISLAALLMVACLWIYLFRSPVHRSDD